MSQLVSEFDQSKTLRSGLKLKNRFVLAPLDLRLALYDGTVSQNDLTFHRSHATAVGMDIVGSAYVQKNGRTRAGALSVSEDINIPGLRKLATAIHQGGAKAILQLSHAGIRAQVPFGQHLVGPSERYGVESLSKRQIIELAQGFAEATNRAIQAGFDGVELQGGNRFLLQQFLSPLINLRCDDFGGSLTNRLRVPLLVVESVLKVAQQCSRPFAVGYRLSPEERYAKGMQVQDTLVLARLLERLKVDYISLSLHDYRQPAVTFDGTTPVVSLFSQQLTTLPFMVAGNVNNVDDLDALGGQADLIAMGRQLIADPEWPRDKVSVDYSARIQSLSASSEISPRVLEGLLTS